MLATTKTTVNKVTSGGSGKRFQKYEPCAAEARRRAEDDAGRREPIQNPGNLELYYFIREAKQVEDAGGGSGLSYALKAAMKSVGQHPTRIRTVAQLKSLSGIGDYMAKVVESVLWREYPPGPADSEEEQLEAEIAATRQAPKPASRAGAGRGGGRKAGAAALAAGLVGPHDIPFMDTIAVPMENEMGSPVGVAAGGRGRGRGRGRSASASARGRGRGRGRKRGDPNEEEGDEEEGDLGGGAQGLFGGLLPLPGAFGLSQGLRAAGGNQQGAYGGGGVGAYGGAYDTGVTGVELGGGIVAVVGAAAPQRKRTRKSTDEDEGCPDHARAPKPGTANYAFLIVMYMARKCDRSKQHWTKEELMEAAQASGLADKSIYGVKDLSAPGNVQNFYDGWSCFRTLVTRAEPLASERTRGKGARGKEFSLTNLGWALAARLYKSALRYREVQPVTGVDEEQVDADIRKWSDAADVVPVMEAYPEGTPPQAVRGRAYKGFQPPPRPGVQEGRSPAGTSREPSPGAAAAGGSGRKPNPGRRRPQAAADENLEDLLYGGSQGPYGGSQGAYGIGGLPRSQGPSGGGGLLGSQGAAIQRLAVGLSGSSQLAGGSQRDSLSYGGGAAAGLLGGVMQGPSSSNLADLFTTTGLPYDSGRRMSGGVTPAAATAAAAEARAAAGAAAAVRVVQQPAVVPGGTSQAAAPVGGAKVRGGGGGSGCGGGAVSGAPAAVEVVDLLDSDSDGGDDEGAAKAGAGQPPDRLPSSQAAAAAARTAGGRSEGSLGGGGGAMDEAFAFLGRMAAEQRQPPQQPPPQPLWSGAGGGLGQGGLGQDGLSQVQGGGNAARKKVQRARKVVVSETAVEELLAMGFEERMARKALRCEGGDLSSALDRLDDGTLSPAGDISSASASEDDPLNQHIGPPTDLELLLFHGQQERHRRHLAPVGPGLDALPTEAAVAGVSGGGGGGGGGRNGKPAAAAAPLGLPPFARDASGAQDVYAAVGEAARGVGVLPPRPRGKGRAAVKASSQEPLGGPLAAAAAALSGGVTAVRAGSAPGALGMMGGIGSQEAGGPSGLQPYGSQPLYGSQQSYGMGSQVPYMGGSQQADMGGSQVPGDGEAAEGGDDRTLLTYEWLLPRMSEVPANHRALPVRLPLLQPGQKFEDEYQVVLLVDNREPTPLVEAVRRQAKDQGVRVVAGVCLTVGDFLWVAAQRGAPLTQASKDQWFVLDAVLERKQVHDLLGSVRDGRYAQQKYRLKRCGLRRLYYLLEECITAGNMQEIDVKTLRTAVQSALLEGFIVLRTANVEDTARQLVSLTRALERQYRNRQGPPAAGAAEEDEEPLLSYSAWDASLKGLKQSMKVQAMFGLMLCAVQGLGEERANRVLARYSTPAMLWEAYKAAMRAAAAAGRDPTAAAEQLLVNEIGAQCSARLYQLLFAKGVPPAQVIRGGGGLS